MYRLVIGVIAATLASGGLHAQERQGSSADAVVRQTLTLDTRYINKRSNFTKLRPTSAFTTLSSEELRVTGIWGLSVKSSGLSFSSQARLTARKQEGATSTDISWDEAFFEANIGDFGFVYLGRRHQSQGKALGVSILDLFNQKTDFDRTLNVERRERDVRGVDSLGMDFFIGDALSLSFVYAPSSRMLNKSNSNRYQLSADYYLYEHNLDLFAAAYYEDRPTLAFGFSKAVDDAFVFYGEATARRGRNRIVPVTTNPVTGTFSNGARADEWYEKGLLGVGYTSPSGFSLNVEYLHNEDGYSGNEWSEIVRLINTNNTNIGGFGGLPISNLAGMAGIFSEDANRQNYTFLRAAHPTVFGLENYSGELTAFHNWDDSSGNMALRLEREIGDTAVLGALVAAYYGGKNSEFGLIGEQLTSGLYVTKNF